MGLSDCCPTCRRPTIQRAAGEWCSFCRAWVVTMLMRSYSGEDTYHVRRLRGEL